MPRSTLRPELYDCFKSSRHSWTMPVWVIGGACPLACTKVAMRHSYDQAGSLPRLAIAGSTQAVKSGFSLTTSLDS
jgi:hypothetical protein